MKYALIVYLLPPLANSRTATTTIAATTAPIATSRPATDVPRIPACASSLTCAPPLWAPRTALRRASYNNQYQKCAGISWVVANPLLRVRVEPSLLRLGTLFARPRARGVGEGGARAAVDGFLGGAEDCALKRARGGDLGPGGVAVLALGRLLVVDQAPDLLEDLLADEAGQQAGDDAEGCEEELHGQKVYPG